MEYLVGDKIGLIHLLSSALALIFGTIVLVNNKGTKRHKQIGYAYVISMVVLLITAFMIYHLFKGWGIFHYAAIVSLLAIVFGMVPILIKKPTNQWKYLHFSSMYWSVVGLYAAFAAEVLTRIPKTPFFEMVGIATGIIMLIGGICFGAKKTEWRKIFKIEK